MSGAGGLTKRTRAKRGGRRTAAAGTGARPVAAADDDRLAYVLTRHRLVGQASGDPIPRCRRQRTSARAAAGGRVGTAN